jgi:ATP-binding cassette subfamily B protein
MSTTNATDWRGIATEETVGRASSTNQARSLAGNLLKSMLAPHKKALVIAAVIVLVRNIAALVGPFLVKVCIDTAIPALQRGDNGPLLAVIAAFVAAALVQAVTDFASLQYIGRLGQTMLYALRCRLFGHVQHLGLTFQERFTSGRIISRLTSDIDAVDELVTNGMQQVAWSVLVIGGSTIVLFALDWRLALIIVALTPFVVISTRWFRSNALEAFRRRSETVALVIMHFVESVRGVTAVQAFRREQRNRQIFNVLNEDHRLAKQRGTRLIAVYGPLIRAIGNVGITIVMLVGGFWVLSGDLTVGVLAAFVLYVRRMVEPAMELSYFYGTVQSAAAALEKIALVLAEKPMIAERGDAIVLTDCRGDIEFQSVTFNYGTGRRLLHDLNLTIPSGQTIALVGETGAGKSSIARLIARLYDPEAGDVTLDGLSLPNLSMASLRTHVVMVTQENFLFSDTIAANIRFGRPDATADDVIAAARAIGADTFISALPDGYDTMVGKRGAELSAGQRQLVAFARAFLADPQVLVLDEATSSLDMESERMVQHALQVLLADRTAIVIAHRLSTVASADRVLVVDKGDVIEDGSPAELIAHGGQFAALHNAWQTSMKVN